MEKKNKAFCHLYFVIKKFEVKVDAFDVVIVAIYVCVLIIKYNLILWWSVIKCLLQLIISKVKSERKLKIVPIGKCNWSWVQMILIIFH